MNGGVMLVEIRPRTVQQLELFGAEATAEPLPRRRKLMLLMDAINARSGRGTSRLAAGGFDHAWTMKRERITPHYTTRWDELAVAKAYSARDFRFIYLLPLTEEENWRDYTGFTQSALRSSIADDVTL